MLDRTDLDDPDVLEAARAATRDAAAQTCRAGEIVRRLRDFVARGEATLRAEDVGDVLTEACALARANGADERAHLQVVVAADTGAVMIDRVQMQQVLLNLIRNAAEAIGPATSGRITLAARRDDDGRVEIAVSDTGPGPDPTVAGRLFLPFVSTKRHGMGIGLAICHSIVEGHGGMIECLPAPEGGACFRIVLPPAAANGRRAA